MSPKGSCQKSSKDGLKLGSFGYELATYFWDGNNHWTKDVVLITRIANMDDSSKEELKEINFKAIKKTCIRQPTKNKLGTNLKKKLNF